MTRTLNETTFGTPFGRWLREQQRLDSKRIGLSIQNLDYIIHRYSWPSVHAMMLIEEKRYMALSPFAQKDTHRLINSALWHADNKPVANSRGQVRLFRYCGYHVLTFENTTPDDGRMWWDDMPIAVSDLFSLLSFHVNPMAFRPSKVA